MTKVSYVDILPEFEEQFWASLRSGDRYVFSRLCKKQVFFSRKRKKGISARSLLPEIATAWNSLTAGEKEDWSLAAENSNLNGYRLFVQDKTARILNDFSGNATPDTLHQSWVGNLKIESPASELKIVQPHPSFYWISRKVGGKKGMFAPVLITENFSLPLKIGLNYSSNLTSTGAGSFAKFYARIWYSYQGVDLFEELTINLGLISDWQKVEATLTELTSYVVRYELYFHLFNVRGDLFFDNVVAEHSAQNWVRDPFCLDINQGFTRAFYQVPKNWAAVILPTGSMLDSVYKDF
jgi:hypothetical protein